MDKLWKVIKALFAVIGVVVLLAAVGIWYFFHSVVPKDDPAATVAMEHMLPAIVGQWDINELQKHLAGNFTVEIVNAPASGSDTSTTSIKSYNITDAAKVFTKAKESLGVMKNYSAVGCHQSPRDGNINCTALVRTEKGKPLVDVDMQQENSQYKITKFRIFNSDF